MNNTPKRRISLASRRAERYRKATVKAVAPEGYDDPARIDHDATIRERYDRDGDKMALELLEEWGAIERYSKDAAGHEHKPAGSSEGGQFASSAADDENQKKWNSQSAKQLAASAGKVIDKISVLSKKRKSTSDSEVHQVFRGVRRTSRGDSYTYWTPERQYAEAYGDILLTAYLDAKSPILDLTTIINEEGDITAAAIDDVLPGLAKELGLSGDDSVEASNLWDANGPVYKNIKAILSDAGYAGIRWIEGDRNEAYILIHDKEDSTREEQYAKPLVTAQRLGPNPKWEESKHHRGQPHNAGQFGPGGGVAQNAQKLAQRPDQPPQPNAQVSPKQPEPPEAKNAKPLTIGGKVFDAFQKGKDWFFRTTNKANWVKAKPHAAKVLSEKAIAADPQAVKEQQWSATQAELQKHVLGHVALAQRRHDIAKSFVEAFNQSFWGSLGLGKKPTPQAAQRTRRQAEQQQARLTRAQRQLERSKARAQVVARQHASLSKAINRNLKEFGLDFDPAVGRTLNEQEFRAHQRTLREVARQESNKHKEQDKSQRQAERLQSSRNRKSEAGEARQERARLAEERRQQKQATRTEKKPEKPQAPPQAFHPLTKTLPGQPAKAGTNQSAFGFADADMQQARIAQQMHEASKANARATVKAAPGAVAQDNAMQRAVKEALAKGKIKPEHMPTAITKEETGHERNKRLNDEADKKKQQSADRRRAAKEHREAEIHDQKQGANQAAEEVGLDPNEFQSYAQDVASEMHGEENDSYNDEYSQLLNDSGLTSDKIEEIENQSGPAKDGDKEGHKRGDATLHVDDALMTQWPKMFPSLGLPQNVSQNNVIEAIKRGPKPAKEWYSPDVVAETKRRIEAVKPGADWEPGMDDDVDDGEFAGAGVGQEAIPFQRSGAVQRYALDASGHEHRGKGERGGQFVSRGTASDATDVRPLDEEPETAKSTTETAHKFDTPNHAGNDTSIASKLSNGKIKDVHGTVKSGINSSFIIETEDGAQGVLKPASGETEGLRPDIPAGSYWRREIAASKIAELMNMGDLVPLTVHRQIRDGDASVQVFCEDASVSRDVSRRQAFDGPADAARAMVFDFIVGNTDRHRGNWMLQKGEKLKLIDNGLCFPEKHGETSLLGISQLQNRLADFYHDLDLSAAAQAWSGKLPEVEKTLREAGISEGAIERTAQRYAIMMKHNKFGDAFNELKAMQE